MATRSIGRLAPYDMATFLRHRQRKGHLSAVCYPLRQITHHKAKSRRGQHRRRICVEGSRDEPSRNGIETSCGVLRMEWRHGLLYRSTSMNLAESKAWRLTIRGLDFREHSLDRENHRNGGLTGMTMVEGPYRKRSVSDSPLTAWNETVEPGRSRSQSICYAVIDKTSDHGGHEWHKYEEICEIDGVDEADPVRSLAVLSPKEIQLVAGCRGLQTWSICARKMANKTRGGTGQMRDGERESDPCGDVLVVVMWSPSAVCGGDGLDN